MKLTKKLLSVLLTLTMLAVMAVPAFAAGGTGTITIKNPNNTATYTAYKILELESFVPESEGQEALYSYKVAAGWENFVNGDGAEYLEVNEAGGVTWVENADPADFAKLAETFAKANNIPAIDIPYSNNSATVTGLDLGYYLVTSTLNNGVLCSLGTTDTTAEITEKNEKPTLDKKLVDENGNELTNGIAGIGDTVNYEIKVTAHPVAESYVVHDKMSAGLTFNTESITVKEHNLGTHKDLNLGIDYTVEAGTLADGCTFHIVFTENYLNTIEKATDIVITYSATINENAVVVSGTEDPLKNVAKLDYNDVTNAVESPVTLKTLKFTLKKVDGSNAPLYGAEFELYDDTNKIVELVKLEDGRYRVATANDANMVTKITAGTVTIEGLDDANYYLKEISAPAGYNKVDENINFNPSSIEEGQDCVTVTVKNYSGTELPSTGGMGTTLFYLGGGAIFLGALVMLVTKKRMKD